MPSLFSSFAMRLGITFTLRKSKTNMPSDFVCCCFKTLSFSSFFKIAKAGK